MRKHDELLAGGHDGDGRLRRFRHRQLGRALKTEKCFRVAVAKVIGNLARLEQHIQRNDGRTRLEDAEVDCGEIWKVRAQQGDVIAAPNA